MKLFVAKNRKREGALLRLLPLTKALVISVVIATVGFGYVWQKNSIKKLGDEKLKCEQQLETLQKRNVILLDQMATLKSPRVIESKCKSWNLGLSVPRESQIVRVADPSLSPIQSAEPDPRATVSVQSTPQLASNNRVHGSAAKGREVREN